MELNSNINTFYKGLDLDSDVSVLDKNSIRYAENIQLIGNEDGTNLSIQNIEFVNKEVIPFETIGVDYRKGLEFIKMTPVKYKYEGVEYDAQFIITKKTTPDGILNDCLIWIREGDLNVLKSLASGYFGWEEELSTIYNRESEDNNNLYIADGKKGIQVFNLNTGKLNDSILSSKLKPFSVDEITDGALKACKVQYAYQLFNLYGNSSTISPLSELIPISATIGGITQNDVSGSTYGTQTTKGVKLTAHFDEGDYQMARVFRIVYEVAGQLPTIYIVDEFLLDASRALLTYHDYGTNYLSVLTVDEFNALRVPYDFVPQVIETKDNRLFAANITEKTWDFEYDARAYRSDINGEVVLKDAKKSDIVFNIDDIPEIPQQYDCINPSNVQLFDEDSFKYVYKDANKTLGGKGKNVSYEFTFLEVALSTQTEQLENNTQPGTPEYTLGLQVEKSNDTYVRYYDSKGQEIKKVDIGKNIIKNYSDPWMCQNAVGYHRDEIYRFGIVFYNDKGIATPVHWIGDIRMPSVRIYESDDENIKSIFKVNHSSLEYKNELELVGHSLGVKFTVNTENLPKDVVAYEIVRCSRTEENRTIIAQVMVNSLIKPYAEHGGGQVLNWAGNEMQNNKLLFPQPFINFSNSQVFGSIDPFGITTDLQFFDTSLNKFELISPEICVDQNNTASVIKNMQLCLYNSLYSVFPMVDSVKHADRIAVTAKKVYGLNGNEYYVEHVSYQDILYNDTFGTRLVNVMPNAFYHNQQGASMVYKYYNTGLRYMYTPKVFTIDSVISPVQINDVIEFKATKDKQLAINDSAYLNISIANNGVWGRHGTNLIISTTENADSWIAQYIPENKKDSIYDMRLNSGLICNIKKPSKIQMSTWSDRQNSIYIGCNAYNKIEETDTYCYGGDTYLCVLDYLNTQYGQSFNDYNKDAGYRIHTQCYIPFETSVNLNLLTNEQYHNTVKQEDGIGQNLIQTEPVAFAGYVQDKPLYQYNTVYSQQNNMFPFVTKGIYAKDELNVTNRIISSELKNNGETSDSWLKFKVANYIDVSTNHGAITNLKTFNNKLFFFQDNAVGIASVNDRVLITDNNMAELTLGTGQILSRFDYVTITNGSSIIKDKSIVASDNGLYWYDFNKNSICLLTNGVQELSKTKKVQSYFNKLKANNKVRNNSVGLFDKKYNEIWIKVGDKTLVFSELLNAFTTFNTIPYDGSCIHDDNTMYLWSTDKTVLAKKNADYEEKNVIPFNSKLTFVVNDNFMYPKVFDNVMFYANFGDNLNNISSVEFKTKNQTSETVYIGDIECREDTYRFSIPREKSDNLYAGRMRGNYLEETFTFDCSNNQTFKIPYIKTTYRQSKI